MLMSDDYGGNNPLCVECYSIHMSFKDELNHLYNIEQKYRMNNPFEGVEVYITVVEEFPHSGLEIEVCQESDCDSGFVSTQLSICYSEISNWDDDDEQAQLEKYIQNQLQNQLNEE